MSYHTGHRLDCNLASDPIECFCGGRVAPREENPDYGRAQKIELEEDLDGAVAFSGLALEVVQRRVMRVIRDSGS